MTVYYSEYGNTQWNLLESQHYYQLDASGKVLLKQSAYDLLPSKFCLRVDGDFANRVPETSANQLQGIVQGLNCLDTIQPDMGFSDGDNFGLGGTWMIGAETWVWTGYLWYADSSPTVIGYYNQSCYGGPYGGALDSYYMGTPYNSSLYGEALRPNEFGWFLNGGGNSTGIGAGIANTTFVQVGAGITVNLLNINYGRELPVLPAGTTILNAWVEVTTPASFVHKEDIWTYCPYSCPLGVGNWHAGNITSNNTGIHANVSWMLVGLRNNGQWETIGTYGDLNGGGIEAGKTKVVKCTELMKKMMMLRDSPYLQMAIYPCRVNGKEFPLSYFNPDHPAISILPGILDSYFDITNLQENTDYPRDDTINHFWTADFEMSSYSMTGNIGLSSLTIQFQLPNGFIKELRLPYGNYPSLLPR